MKASGLAYSPLSRHEVGFTTTAKQAPVVGHPRVGVDHVHACYRRPGVPLDPRRQAPGAPDRERLCVHHPLPHKPSTGGKSPNLIEIRVKK